jgi:hypothetical protein
MVFIFLPAAVGWMRFVRAGVGAREEEHPTRYLRRRLRRMGRDDRALAATDPDGGAERRTSRHHLHVARPSRPGRGLGASCHSGRAARSSRRFDGEWLGGRGAKPHGSILCSPCWRYSSPS